MRPALLRLLTATVMTSALTSAPRPALVARTPPHAASVQAMILAPAAAQVHSPGRKKDSRREAVMPLVMTLALLVAIAVRRYQPSGS